MKIKGSTLVAGLCLIIGVFGIITSLTFKHWESMTLPLITSSLVFILAIVQLCLDLRKRSTKDVNNIITEDRSGNDEIKKGLIITGWTAGFCLAVFIFGFYIAIPSFSIAYLKTHSRSWITSISFTVIILGFIYLVFNIALKAPLYAGFIFSLLK